MNKDEQVPCRIWKMRLIRKNFIYMINLLGIEKLFDTKGGEIRMVRRKKIKVGTKEGIGTTPKTNPTFSLNLWYKPKKSYCDPSPVVCKVKAKLIKASLWTVCALLEFVYEHECLFYPWQIRSCHKSDRDFFMVRVLVMHC